MDGEPFLGHQTRSQLEPIPESLTVPAPFSQSLSDSSIFHETHQDPELSITESLAPNVHKKKKQGTLQRCKTAPAMAVMQNLIQKSPQIPKPQPVSNSVVRQGILLLLGYLSLGVAIYSFNRDHFSGTETHPIVDALYYSIVTLCTIGYGDIAPITTAAKLFACVFVLVGFGFIDILLSGVVNYVLDLQENMILTGFSLRSGEGFSARNYIVDVDKGRMRIRLKVGLALGVVVFSIGIGTFVLYFVENLSWMDSVYLSVMSVTTVGYGDKAFKTLQGRLFAAIWLLFSTIVVGRAFLYLAEARVNKRHRIKFKWVLHRDITIEDLFAADLNNTGFVSKSEYVIFKLKEMGKIKEKDILQICDQFSKLDRANSGKITLPHLLNNQL
ncbi:Two-pore potassium channel like [Quillaja saponaria]|uniref:Two-pore potassium channel like n=1 Tax=Quillaja saponaria TaxID=32244 RepID=A0AAD7Q1Z7_QUISA|nr:Two-pore potassium channel like [Quillaja saponaria]